MPPAWRALLEFLMRPSAERYACLMSWLRAAEPALPEAGAPGVRFSSPSKPVPPPNAPEFAALAGLLDGQPRRLPGGNLG